MRNIKILAILVALELSGILLAQTSWAAVSDEEAKQLGTTLTKFGAEKAGNKDGSIPAYTGGVENVPGYDQKTMWHYIDPFAGEKPLYSVSAKNMQEYEDMLNEGTKELMRLHTDYRIDVYPTHRSVRYTDWVLENTLKNSTTVKLTGEIEGDAVRGADKDNLPFPGVPFPIPKNGYEVMWNYKMQFGPALSHSKGYGYMADSAGKIIPLPTSDAWHVRPWYDRAGRMRGMTQDALMGYSTRLIDPPASAGMVFLNFYMANAENGGQNTWFYTPGQRRVRRAPEFSYDVPVAAYVGIYNWDEPFGFVGRMDRFDFKLVGKKEMLVPYNEFGITNTMNHEEYFGSKFIKPEALRFEKHRIWVVEGTRKPDARHVCSRKLFYIDEDSWAILLYEAYDNGGNLWRMMEMPSFPAYDVGGIDAWAAIIYDVLKGNYGIVNTMDQPDEPKSFRRDYDSSDGLNPPLTPAAVSAASIR